MYRSKLKRRYSNGRPYNVEQLEARMLLAADWRNPANPIDVSHDTYVSPLDALLVINDLNRGGPSQLGPRPIEDEPTLPYLDVNGDGHRTPLDALLVINELNRTLKTPVFRISEGQTFVADATNLITLGQEEGSRVLRLEVSPDFDTSDQTTISGDSFQVYLVDATDPGTTILDRGPGTSLFSLNETSRDFQAGRVTFDGSILQIDLTALQSEAEGHLLFQLLNGDGDLNSQVMVRPLTNRVNEEGTEVPTLALTAPSLPAPTLDLTTLTTSTDVELQTANTRYNVYTGRFAIELEMTNLGPDIGRSSVVVLRNLPAGVTPLNASGSTTSGEPFYSFRNAIPAGGLRSGAESSPVLVEIANPAGVRFSLQAEVLVSGPNRAPQLQPVSPLVVSPGATVSVDLIAPDPDGDLVTFMLQNASGLPSGILEASGQLRFFPELDQLGTYNFDVIASDGVLTTSQPVVLSVVEDPVQTTRISGVIKSTLEAPLDGVPVEIAGFSSVTGADGSFTISLPTMKVPTEPMNIPIPAGDPFFDPLGTGDYEIRFRRARHDVTTGRDPSNPRRHPNLVTSFIDASIVYGSDDGRASALRTFSGGRLKVSSNNLLPLNDLATFPDGPLENDNESRLDPATLFVSGDVRTNENVPLIAVHVLLMREHNRLADEIAAANPSFSDEEIYQRARRTVGAIIQHITYHEYLPLLLGSDAIPAYNGYDPNTNPNESAIFAAAAFRVGHTQLFSQIQRLDAMGQSLPGGSLTLKNAFFTPQPIKDDGIEPFLRGLAASQTEQVDAHVIDDVRNFLFGPPGAGGMDLPAVNIQRGRDVGLPTYNQARIDFGLPPRTSFAEITSDPTVQAGLQAAYGTVDKVDVWVGGVAEDRAPGALIGPLFQTIVADQFRRGRDGDRFWYENAQFNANELAEIRQTTMKELIVRNATILPTELPDNVFTIGAIPAPPAAGGSATNASPEFRTFTGVGNNLSQPSLGSTGEHVLTNFTLSYADGISEPAGADREGARTISNHVNAQSGSIPNTAGATGFVVFWGQIIDHDLGLTPGGVSDTLRILGQQRPNPTGDESYPFVAEPMELLLGHGVYPGVNNVVQRPIYLPLLNDGEPVDPNFPGPTQVIGNTLQPGEEPTEVLIVPGTLKDRQGALFAGDLSITEVPRQLTPAALPEWLLPDLVITIQPADLVFTTPARLNAPNRAGFSIGEVMDLWSINPITGYFGDVGDGIVRDLDGDGVGEVIETTSGGIRNSSWHFFAPPAPSSNPSEDNERNEKEAECACTTCPCTASAPAGSDVLLHSGAYRETHDLVPYHSLGATRGLQLVYDSLRADPRPIVHFDYSNVVSAPDRRLMAKMRVKDAQIGEFGQTVATTTDNFWSIPSSSQVVNIDAALQIDMSTVPTGRYRYTVSSGIVRYTNGNIFGSLFPEDTGSFVHVNTASGPFGSGWGLSGLQEIVMSEDHSALIVDGNGTETIFEAPAMFGSIPLPATFHSPPGDFSKLEFLPDHTFRRTMKDQTVYQFNTDNKLASVTDRNGNVTNYEYSQGVLSKIIDPVAQETTFTQQNGRITSITDPALRTTHLQYDAAGNLVGLTDPDTTIRSWEYDTRHHITAEITKRQFREETHYDFAGRVTRSVTRDGNELGFSNAQTVGLYPQELTVVPASPPVATITSVVEAYFIDENGRVQRTKLDQAGQMTSTNDGGGPGGAVTRNFDNLPVTVSDARSNLTSYTYNDRGNVLSIRELLGKGGPLFSGQQFVVDDGPTSIVAADFNGDAIPDLATANRVSDNVSVLLGNGDGTFQTQRTFAVGDGAFSVTAADFNGDAIPDLATANRESDNVSVLLGNGDGTFQSQRTFAVGDVPSSVTAADFNGDAIPDLATANSLSDDVSVLIGNGDGTFQSQRTFTVGDYPSSVTTADFNGDEIPDLATANSFSDNVSVLLGNGDGTFQSQRTFAVGNGPSSVTAADFNGDAIPDLATANFFSDNVSVLLGNGDGTLQSQRTFAVSDPESVTAADFNGDAIPDLATANRDSDNVSVLLGNGDGTFQSQRTFAVGIDPSSVTAADFNGDAIPDLATPNFFSNNVSVLIGNGDGTFQSQRALAVGDSPASVTAADFNGDAIPDLATANRDSSNVSVLIGNGDGTFQSQRTFAVGVIPSSVTAADFNGDAIPDLATANSLSDDVSVLIGNGDGTFQSQRTFAVGNYPQSMTAVDLNGDDTPDLATANFLSNNVSVLLGNGDGTFQSQRTFAASDPISVMAADFNGDEIPDLATANNLPDNVSVLLGNGDGTFQSQRTFTVGIDPSSVTAADFNGDAIPDLATANGFSDNVSVLLGNGDGTFQSQRTFAVGIYPRSITAADLNGDDTPDLATANYLSSNVSVLLGNGDGTFQSQLNFAVGDGPESVTAADFNGDGATDLATANSISDDVSVLMNKPSAAIVTRQFTYDPTFSQLASVTDELGHQTLYEIDPANGNRLSMTQVLGLIDNPSNGETDDLITRYTYTAAGLVDTMTDPNGEVTDYEYDSLGRLTQVTYALGTSDEAFQRFEYDAAGLVTASIDENGHRTEYEYDPLNRLTRTIEPDPDGPGPGNPLTSPITRYFYDEAGYITRIIDSENRETRHEYDGMDRRTKTIDPDPDGSGPGNPLQSPETHFEYDDAGNLIAVIDPNGNATRHEYDSRNRRTRTTDPDGGITHFRYDLDNNMIALIDPVGNRTSFSYDQRNRMTREIDPFGKTTTYTYDPADRLFSKIDRMGRKIRYTYDDADRMLTETWLAENGSTENVITYDYDDAGNLLSAHDNQSSLVYTYDHRHRVETVDNRGSEPTQGTPGAPRVVLTYGYDDLGNVVSVSDTINGQPGALTSYGYDALDRLKQQSQSGPGLSEKLVNFSYNSLGQYSSINRYRDLPGTQLVVGTTYVYDGQNRLDVMRHETVTSQIINFHNLDYDSASRITRITDIDGTHDYTYDDRDQLVGANHTAPGGGEIPNLPDEFYIYDANGNREESHLHSTGYVTGPGNRLLSDGTYNYTYDDEGNTLSRGRISGTEPDGSIRREFSWDQRNRLISVIDKRADGTPTQEVRFSYDALDRRITKAVDTTPTDPVDAAILHFVNNREDVLLDYLDSDGSGPAAAVLSQRYLHGPGIDQVLAQDDAAGMSHWHLTDHLGTVKDLASNTSQLAMHALYDVFGSAVMTLPGTTSRYSFIGREWDAEVGSLHVRMRNYNPTFGAFLSEDSIRPSSDTNYYRYALNNPLARLDPTGLDSFGWIGQSDLNNIGSAIAVPFSGAANIHASASSVHQGWIHQVAIANQNRYSGRPGYPNAIRHLTWMALISYQYGTDAAHWIGDGHETGDALLGCFDTRRDSATDLNNNRVGRLLGEALREQRLARGLPVTTSSPWDVLGTLPSTEELSMLLVTIDRALRRGLVSINPDPRFD